MREKGFLSTRGLSALIGRAAFVTLVTVGVSWTAAFAAAADIQESYRPLYKPMSIAMALNEKPVQEDLGMTPQQAKAAQAALDKVRKKHFDDDGKLYRAAAADKKKMADDFSRQLEKDSMSALPSVLRPDQVERLKQILHQEMGSGLIEHPQIRAIMKISDEQLAQLKEIQEGLKNDLIEKVKAGQMSRVDAGRKNQLNLKLIPPKVQEALSPEQRKILKGLLGVRLVR